jgi:uncharacterized protein (TIGR03435 family)
VPFGGASHNGACVNLRKQALHIAYRLSGVFDGELTFALEPLPGFPRLPGSENGVSVYTALQEQLGLRLEAGRGPVEIIVIESAEKPTDN